jgi:23S rRNA (uracil1939-C5)-methyltransferase
VWQNLDYKVQLAYKAQQVRESLERLGGLRDFEVRPILGMADPWRYRNRVDFSIGCSPEGAVVGYRPAGRWDTVLPLSECHLVSENMEGVRASVEGWLRARELPGWNPRTAEGFARHLVVRRAQGDSELLVNLVTYPGDLPDEEGLVDALRSTHPGIVGVAHSFNEGRAELSAGLESRMLWGRPYVLEGLAGITLKVSLDAFFQTNTQMAHMLIGAVADEALGPNSKASSRSGDYLMADRDSGPVIWDLYSGVGSIGLSLAGLAAAVLGVETSPAAVSDAQQNANLNGIENSSFLEGDVRRVLREVAQGSRRLPVGLERPDVVVVDPPRSGLHKRVVFRIGEMAVPRIVYVSCNPATMAPNLAQFQDYGYCLERVTPVDMFPHTPHVEAVGLLVREG